MLIFGPKKRALLYSYHVPATTRQSCQKEKVQSGASSRAKHGGAYFSAVYGSIEDPMAAPGPYENLSRHCSRICSGTGLMYLSPNKYMRPASEQILLECPLMSGSCVCVRGKTKVTG